MRRLLAGRDRETQARLEGAVAAVDRELAANLELTTLYDQTRMAVVLENGEFGRHRALLERELPAAFLVLVELYRKIPEAEAAMERRGPVNSVRAEDRAIVQGWEGDARTAQRAVRQALVSPPPPFWRRLLGLLLGGRAASG